MKILIATLLIIISTITLQAKDNKDKITVLKDNVENINIEVKSDYFVAIELENEIQGFMPLQLQGVQAQKLNNKTIVIYTYNDNLPKNLGKIIITDSNCNKYSLNLKENEKITKDTSIYIKNSNTEKKCEALSKDNSYFPRAGAVTYDVVK
jgi:hypothetical protein